VSRNPVPSPGPPGGGSVAQNAGWTLQFLALVVVGAALLVGLAYDALRAEVTLLGAGGAIFLLGRWLRERPGA
jgi:hypothetical protein